MSRGFLDTSSLFTRFSSTNSSFFMAFRFPNLLTRFKNLCSAVAMCVDDWQLTLARFTLSGCESDRYKVGYDPIHIRFTSVQKFALTLSG